MRISDWSSDVCSSDLDHADRHLALGVVQPIGDVVPAAQVRREAGGDPERAQHLEVEVLGVVLERHLVDALGVERGDYRFLARSEERRVGKECVSTCRSRWSQYL